MASIEEEMMQSRQAAEEIIDPKEAKRKRQAEGMARASGGISVTDRREIQSNPGAILSAWAGREAKDVKSGKVSSKKYHESGERTNYTGMIDLNKALYGETSTSMGTNEYASAAEDDFVSAWFNDHIPLKEYGVKPISRDKIPSYRGLFSKNYSDIVSDEGFRGYQIRKENLDVAPELDKLAREGKYTYTSTGVDDKRAKDAWRIGEIDALYDSNDFTKVSVILNGKKYSKNIDVFDVNGLDKKVPVVGRMTRFIADNASRYFVTSPWYEDDEPQVSSKREPKRPQ